MAKRTTTIAIRMLDQLGQMFVSPRVGTVEPGTNIIDPVIGSMFPTGTGKYRFSQAPDQRRKEMLFWDYLCTEVPDTSKAVSAYATMATTGSVTGGGSAGFMIKRTNGDIEYPAKLIQRLDRLTALIHTHAFTVVRGMAKYGSYTPYIKVDRLVGGDLDGDLAVTDMEHLPPATMFRILSKDGQSDSDRYWVQTIDGRNKAEFPRWRIPHFAVWTDVVNSLYTLLYGTSILKADGRVALQLMSVLDALVVARLSRAAQRYLFKVDVNDIRNEPTKILERLKKYQNHYKREPIIRSDGTVDTVERASVPDEDFFIPAAKDLAYDVDTLQGDINIGNIKDVELLLRIHFGALGVPPEYLGHDRSQGGRSVLSQIDIQFARMSRHLQGFAAKGFEHVIYVDMILGGFDPRDYPVECMPPSIGARDDLLQAQIRSLQAQTIANLKAAGFDLTLDPRWVLQIFMGMDDDLLGIDETIISKLFRNDPVETPGGPKGGGSTRSVDALAAQLKIEPGRLRFILAQNTEAILSNMKALLAIGSANDPTAQLYGHDQPTIEDLLRAVPGRV